MIQFDAVGLDEHVDENKPWELNNRNRSSFSTWQHNYWCDIKDGTTVEVYSNIMQRTSAI